MKASSNDYVLLKKGEPKESLDVIYHHSSVVDLFNNGFVLEEDEAFTPMSELPLELLHKYAK